CAGGAESSSDATATATTTGSATIWSTTTSTGDGSDDYACSGGGGTVGFNLHEFALREVNTAAKPPRWRLENGECDSDRVVAVDIDADGFFYIAGWRAQVNGDCYDTCPLTATWVRRVSPSATDTALWVADFPSEIVIEGIVASPDSGAVVVGVRRDEAATAGYDGAPWIAALDPEGALRWEETLAGSGALRAVDRAPEGGVVAVGDVAVGDGASDLFVARFADDGTELWSATHDVAPYEAWLGVAVDELGRAWIAGVGDAEPVADEFRQGAMEWEYGGAFRLNSWAFSEASTARVALLDDAGQLLWEHVPPEGPEAEKFPYAWAAAIDLLPGGDAVVGGASDRSHDWAARYDSTGAIVWRSAFGGDGVTALRIDDAGAIYVINTGSQRMTKLDELGEKIWSQSWLDSDVFALDPAGLPVAVDYTEDGHFFPKYLPF
ncbi:MAG: hypothetical protein KC486_35240, partial [Myxococcales bacterium]|nr:hypothetical protein [Myxococcales bacterium]